MAENFLKTERTTVKRKRERANYDKAEIFALIDKAFFATVAFNDGHNTHAIPTAIWREENYLYIHGSNGSRLLQGLQKGAQACVSITHMRGLVLARAAISHSMNYDSICIYGIFEPVETSSKEFHMKNFLEHWMPNRWQHVRRPIAKELASLTILRMPIEEVVLKSRQGPPTDYEHDLQHAVWAGVIPLGLRWQNPQQVPEQKDTVLFGKPEEYEERDA